MRILIALAFALWPLTVVAGGIYEIETKDDDTTSTTDVYIEGKSLKMGIAPGRGEPNTDEVMIRREDGGVTVILVDHRGRVYSEGRIEGVGPSVGLLPTGRMEMAPGGIKLHIGGAPSDIWIQVKRTGEVGEILQWLSIVDEVSRRLGDTFPEPFDNGFLNDELSLVERSGGGLDPSDFKLPSGYTERELILSSEGAGKTTVGLDSPLPTGKVRIPVAEETISTQSEAAGSGSGGN